MDLREKCLVHTDFKSDQIAVLEKMLEHFVLLRPYYREMVLVINGHCRQVILINSRDQGEVVLYDYLKEKSWLDDQDQFCFTGKGKEKRVPLYFEKDKMAGMVIYQEELIHRERAFEELLDLCQGAPDSFHPTDYLVPDGVVVFDAGGLIRHQNFVAANIFYRLGFKGMSLNELVFVLGNKPTAI